MGNIGAMETNNQCLCGSQYSFKHLIFDCKQVAKERREFLEKEATIRKKLPNCDHYNLVSPAERLANALCAKIQPHYNEAQMNWYYKNTNPLWEKFLAGHEPHQHDEAGGVLVEFGC